MESDATLPTPADFVTFVPIQTRWMDNDVYGHINNVLYYSYFDTAINLVLVRAAGLDIHAGPVIGLCVESQCRYVAPAAYPDALEAGLAVARLGRSSVTYALGIFRVDDATAATGPTDPIAPTDRAGRSLLAFGRFVHVFVDRLTRRPTPLPDAMRQALAPLVR
ncbi:MAG: thioesterase family protein [Myxococcota bacterium]